MNPVHLNLEIARTSEERARGLMHRRYLAPNAGMLFVFDALTLDAFWNQNTLIPLSIAYLGADGRILSIQDMQPTIDGRVLSYPAPAPYRYALETNQGWFQRVGIREGDLLRFNPAVTRPA